MKSDSTKSFQQKGSVSEEFIDASLWGEKEDDACGSDHEVREDTYGLVFLLEKFNLFTPFLLFFSFFLLFSHLPLSLVNVFSNNM